MFMGSTRVVYCKVFNKQLSITISKNKFTILFFGKRPPSRHVRNNARPTLASIRLFGFELGLHQYYRGKEIRSKNFLRPFAKRELPYTSISPIHPSLHVLWLSHPKKLRLDKFGGVETNFGVK